MLARKFVVPARIIRDAPFAKRLTQACDANERVPQKHRGRLTWLRDQLAKPPYSEHVSVETCRKWFEGEARPKPNKIPKLAQLLQVDAAWLGMGIDPDMTPRERKLRNAEADGAVNLVAGLIQMDGGHPAFPVADGRSTEHSPVDIRAVIRGAAYDFHIALAEVSGTRLRFAIPVDYRAVMVLGVLRDGFSLRVVELSPELIERRGTRRGGSIEVIVSERDKGLRWIESFRERL
jgi:hypothetical protein